MSDAQTDALVERVLSGQAPLPIRSAAARGALPLPRAALVRLFVALREDEDPAVRAAAEASLGELGRDAVLELLDDRDCASEVLAHFAERLGGEEPVAEKVVFHPRTPTRVLAGLAASGNAPIVELVLTNQERLLEEPLLIERLMENPAVRADQRGRILELLERASRRRAEEGEPGAAAVGEELDAEAAARLLDVDVGELLSASEILGAEEFLTTNDLDIRSTFQRIVQLSTAQKALLAMKGGREERSILVRDTNKVVSLGVLKNPRLGEDEVEVIARMRNVTDEVLRFIGARREWTKNYPVVLALVGNPRTPQGVSTNFVSRLNNRDLRSLGSSRDVPELIRRMAKRTFELRTQKSERGIKPKH